MNDKPPKEVTVKPQNPLRLAASVAKHIQVADIFLISSSSRNKNAPEESEGGKVSIEAHEAQCRRLKRKNELLHIDIELKLKIKSKPGRRITYLMSATYRICYKFIEKVALDDQALECFADINAVYNVWPYWREYVHSMSSKMRINPPIVIPVYRISDYLNYVSPIAKLEGVIQEK